MKLYGKKYIIILGLAIIFGFYKFFLPDLLFRKKNPKFTNGELSEIIHKLLDVGNLNSLKINRYHIPQMYSLGEGQYMFVDFELTKDDFKLIKEKYIYIPIGKEDLEFNSLEIKRIFELPEEYDFCGGIKFEQYSRIPCLIINDKDDPIFRIYATIPPSGYHYIILRRKSGP